MSQIVAHPAPSVFQLRRKKVPDELSLPPDYVQPDYTSLGDEPEPRKSRGPFILIALIFLLLALAGGYYVMNSETEVAPILPKELNITRADLFQSGDDLLTRIDVTTANVDDGTLLEAEFLENGQPFAFWDESNPQVEVLGNKAEFRIPAAMERDNPARSAEYSVRVKIQTADGVETIEDLSISSAVEDAFYEGGVAAVPTARPTSTPRPEPSATPENVQPTADVADQPVGPIDNISISRPGIAYQSPYGPSISVGEIAPGQLTKLVAKLPIGTETWYLVPVPVSNVSGWINSNLIDLPPADVNRIPTVSGDFPFAVVFSGGNLRNAPVNGDSIGVADAGINVRLVSRLADNTWFQVEAPDGTTGWISGVLLTINPEIIANVAISQ